MGKKFFFFGFHSRIRDADGHIHITKTKHGELMGGSKIEHERLQDIGVGIEEAVTNIEKKHGSIDTVEFERISDAIEKVVDKYHD